MKKVKKFFENGRTMLEMLAVLAIIASIGIGISAGITHGLTVYHASILQTQLPQIKKAIENTYSFSPNMTTKYANIGSLTGEQYTSMFGDIFGKEACTDAGCKTAGGLLSLHAIANGRGFKATFTGMSKGICQELADVARGENNSILSSGFIMANSCNEDSKQEIDFATITGEYGNCPGNQISIDGNCQCLRADAIGEECVLPENETHDNDNNSGVVSSDTTTTTAVQYTSKDEDEASTVISTSLEHTAATNASIVYNSDAGTTTSSATTLATETTIPYATEPTSSVPETTTAGMTTQTPTMAPMTTATTAPLTTTDNGVANVGDGNTTAILAITTAEPTTTAGMTTQTPTMTPTTTATQTATAMPTTSQLPETTTAGMTTQTPTMAPTATAMPTTSQLPETTTAGMTTQTPTMAPTTTAMPVTIEYSYLTTR